MNRVTRLVIPSPLPEIYGKFLGPTSAYDSKTAVPKTQKTENLQNIKGEREIFNFFPSYFSYNFFLCHITANGLLEMDL